MTLELSNILDMKTLYALIFILLSGTAYGQSNLPACQGRELSKWSNCFGSWTGSNGDKYLGEWKNGNANGQGTKTWANGDKYVGEYKDDKKNGQGTYRYSNGDKYVGEWKDDKKNGQGTYTWPNGDKYVGEWKDNNRTGQGINTWADGEKYVGEFEDSKLNGRGIFYSADGSTKHSGIYQDDKLVTSQYIDPNSFTRIAINSKPPVVNQPEITQDTRRRLALVIGNDSYSSLPSLNNAVNDSKAMSDALRQVNFEVYYYKNLSKRQMEEALNNFSKKLSKDDVGMFYFAGHGIQADNRNFLIPVGENVKKPSDVQFEGVDVDRVMASLKDSRNFLNIVVLDACRNSLDTRGGMNRGLTVTDAPQGSIVAFATSPGKTASDGDSGNSPFTKNLIRVMQRKGLKIEDVFKEVRVAVSRETNGEQVPQELSQLVSDFYFRP